MTLAWDSLAVGPEGYRVFARKSGATYDYSQPVWDGTAVTCTIDNLDEQTEYYFVARAYDGSMESADSNEAHYIPPESDETQSSSGESDTSEADVTPPSWNGATVGIGLVNTNGTNGSAIVEFDTAIDLIDGSDLRFNVYYAPTVSWNDFQWTDNSVIANAVVNEGGTFSNSVTVSGLADSVDYTFGVRAEDRSGNEDANTNTLTGSIVIDETSTQTDAIPQSGWTLLYVDSEETVGEDGRAENAFDGDPDTLWHTQWLSRDPLPPHEIRIDLGSVYDIGGFRYLPIQENGHIRQYAFYVSADGVDWGSAVATGSFVFDLTEKEVVFPTATGRYIRLVALSEVNGNPWTSMAELSLLGAGASGGNQAPEGAIDTPTGNVSIAVGESVDFSGSGSDPDGDEPLSYLWDFGDPDIADAMVADPGLISFDTAGVYTVSLTVTDSLGLSDPTPATRRVTVIDETSTQTDAIPQSGWTLLYVDSEENVGEDGRAENAFDGDPDTLWHTQWLSRDPLPPHEIRIDLGSVYDIGGFRYLPIQENGHIRQYAFYVSTDGVDWGSAVATGSFVFDLTEKEVVFPTATGRYIRLVALSEVNGNPWTSAAEINVLGRRQ